MHVLPREERWRGSSAARPLVKRGLCHPLSLSPIQGVYDHSQTHRIHGTGMYN